MRETLTHLQAARAALLSEYPELHYNPFTAPIAQLRVYNSLNDTIEGYIHLPKP